MRLILPFLLGLPALVLADPIVRFDGALFARDTQPICKDGSAGGCTSGTYSSEEDCQQECYGV